MSENARIAPPTAAEARVGDPAYGLLTLAAGALLQVGTRATPYVSSLALAPRGAAGRMVGA